MMRKLTYITLFSVFFIMRLWAQEIIIQPPVFGMYECTEFYQLYAGNIMNFSDQTFETSLFVEVFYSSPNGNSSKLADGFITGNPSIAFTPGSTFINSATYESIYPNRNIQFYNSEIENILRQAKCLPPGIYDVCLTLYAANEQSPSENFLSQTCYQREKQMLSQLFLVNPFDQEEIQIDLPLFSWTPVSPFNPNAAYRLQIVEILTNQTPYEAFRSNPLFFEQKGIMNNILQYPVAARTMLPCTKYAWRVNYELGNQFVDSGFLPAPSFFQESEIWVYTVPCDGRDLLDDEDEEDEEEDEFLAKQYFKAKTYQPNTYDQTDNNFRFEIDNPYDATSDYSYQIIDDKGETLNVECCPIFQDLNDEEKEPNNADSILKNGENLLLLDLEKLGLSNGKYYKFVFNGLKEKQIINFKYQLYEDK